MNQTFLRFRGGQSSEDFVSSDTMLLPLSKVERLRLLVEAMMKKVCQIKDVVSICCKKKQVSFEQLLDSKSD